MFSILDYPLEQAVTANDFGFARPSKLILLATESLAVRLRMRMEGESKPDLLQSSDVGFDAKFSGNNLPICNLRVRRGLALRNRTRGSNPSRSATQSGLQRKSSLVNCEKGEICPYFAIFASETGPKRTD